MKRDGHPGVSTQAGQLKRKSLILERFLFQFYKSIFFLSTAWELKRDYNKIVSVVFLLHNFFFC
jgi:hypothetical protein